jgi:hypothetical protein
MVFMNDLNLKQYEPYLFLAFGLLLILSAVFKKGKSTELKNTGEKVEGIIHELGQAPNYNSSIDSFSDVKDNVTVRFVTKEQEWITADVKQPFALFFTGQYKPGDKVDVFYDLKNPSNFYIDTKQSETLGRIVVAAAGIVFTSIGAYMLYTQLG